jgi:hypothetical protein
MQQESKIDQEGVNDKEVISPEIMGVSEEVREEPEIRYEIESYNNKSSLTSNSNSQFAVVQDTANALDAMKSIAQQVLRSNLCPLKTEGDVILAIITGQQYGFSIPTSIASIYPINGRPTLSVHLQRGLLQKAGIIWEKIYNFEPIYQYFQAKENPDGSKTPVLVGSGTKAELPERTALGQTTGDFITKYKFSRDVKRPNGSWREQTVESEYRISEATAAGLFSKDTWNLYPKRMLDARAFTIGAKEIGADILQGVYSISELAEVFKFQYKVSENLEEEIIHN